MPLFYFELDNGLRHFEDYEGSEHASADAARRELVEALTMLAKDELPDGNVRDFSGSLMDDTRKVLFNATLSLRSGWVDR